MGRRTKLTRECFDKIIECKKLGMYDKDIAAVAGICVDSLHEWRNRGERGEGKIYVEFSEALKSAEPAAKAAKIQLILEAAKGGQEIKEQKIVSRKVGDNQVEILEQTVTIRQAAPQWQAGAWYLERRYPEEFGRKQVIDLHDWRKQVEQTGLNPKDVENVVDRVIEEVAARIAGGDEAGDLGTGA